MAIAIGSAPDEVIVRIQFRDIDGEEVIKTVSLDGDTTDTQVTNFMTYLDALTNAGVVKASVISSRPITGFTAAADALQNTVGAIMALTFSKTNPINASKTVNKAFIVPAFVNALKDTDKKPVEANSSLNSLITLLELILNYEGADGNFYPGAYDYNRTASGFGTVNREIDGL